MEALSTKSIIEVIKTQREKLKQKNKWPFHIVMSYGAIKRIVGKSNTREHLDAKVSFKETFINKQ